MILVEMTVKELVTATEKAFPDTDKRHNATSDIRVESTTFIPTSGGLMVKSDVKNTNKGSVSYTNILIENVDFCKETDAGAIRLNGTDGAHFIQPINLDVVDVKVNCTCLDFRFRFAMWNYEKESLIGEKPAPYKRKTETHPSANPTHSPGVCKHLIKSFESFQEKLS